MFNIPPLSTEIALGMIMAPTRNGGNDMHRFYLGHLEKLAQMVRSRLQFAETGLNVDFHLVKI